MAPSLSIVALVMADVMVNAVAAWDTRVFTGFAHPNEDGSPEPTEGGMTIRTAFDPLFIRAPDATCGYIEGDKSKHISYGNRRVDSHHGSVCPLLTCDYFLNDRSSRPVLRDK